MQTNKGYDFSRDRGPRTYRGYLLLFDIEEKQSVIKINGGSNHCHHAKRGWVVETTNSWHNRFRRLLVRYEEKLGVILH